MADSRQALADESALLDAWANAVTQMGGNNQETASRWSVYFSRWSQLNADLAGLSDADFNQELDKEVARLEKMRNALAGDNSKGAKFWVDMLNLDIAGAKELKI
jgi:hypothetical protein